LLQAHHHTSGGKCVADQFFPNGLFGDFEEPRLAHTASQPQMLAWYSDYEHFLILTEISRAFWVSFSGREGGDEIRIASNLQPVKAST
jgi:hypothetical protein